MAVDSKLERAGKTERGIPPLRLLVIDDDPANVELIQDALEQADLEILTATDPIVGMELFAQKKPAIVLVDLVMPHLNGMEVLDRMVAEDSSVEVVLMTGQYSTESAVEAIRKGAADYLNKPVSIQKLRERVGRLIEEHRTRQRADRKSVV